jgi:hypothetical protein
VKNSILFLLFCLIPFAIQANDHTMNEDVYEKMLATTERYMQFINRISQGEDFPQAEAAKNVLAANCRKVLNGVVYTHTSDAFIADLLEVNRTKGNWRVEAVDIIPSPQTRTMVLREMIKMERLGELTTIVIMRFDDHYLISEVNVVLSKVEGSYHLDE